MDEELIRRYQRWLDADEDGRDDEADAACRAVFASALPEPRVAGDFAARAAQAIADARVRDLASARRTRRVAVAGSLAAAAAGIYLGGPWALSMLSAMLVGALDLLVGATVRVASGMDAGGDAWSLVSGLGRAAAAFVANPTVTAAMLAMQGIAMAALVTLHRLLGPDRESLK